LLETAINVFGRIVAVKLVKKFSGDLVVDDTQPAPVALQTQDA
jgi:dicarboxylate/amino acid:cation (Na+ or H+) symporter, DAACS family